MALPAEERIFNLILALLATEVGLTKDHILGTVSGYEDQAPGPSRDRLFERDKTHVRELGLRIETLPDPADPTNNQHARYRIELGSYGLPEDIGFTPEELSVLGLAATVWREGSLSAESQRALTKLAGLGIAAADPLIGFTPLVRALEAAMDPLREAIEDQVVVAFDYLRAGGSAPRRRVVSPLALVNHEGRWLLIAAEADGARKTFLLRRIIGRVQLTGDPAIAPDPDEAERALADLDAFRAGNAALIQVVPGSDAERRLRYRSDTVEVEPGLLEIHWTDLEILAGELLAMQPHATVCSPPVLVSRIRGRLQELAVRHG